MTSARISRVWGTILLTITIFSLSLPAYAKYSGGTGEPNDPYRIATPEDLIALGNEPNDYDKHFILTADIDLDPNLPGRKVFDKAVIAGDADSADSAVEYFQGTPFKGVFDGNGHVVSHLTIKGVGYLSLFGQLESGAEIRDLAVVDVNVTGSGSYVAGMVGSNGSILGYYTSGGGVTRCYSTGTISGKMWVGGLVGYNQGTVSQCYSAGMVSGTGGGVGGLVGENWGTVIQCCSNGVVSGRGSDAYGGTGGLVGENGNGSVTQCYSSASVSGTSYVGGLIGIHDGELSGEAMVTYCYSTGAVTGEDHVGGLVGAQVGYDFCDAFTAGCFWDIQTSGQATSASGVGLTTAEMRMRSTFFIWGTCGNEGIWIIDDGNDYPRLWWEDRPGEVISNPPLSHFLTGAGTDDDPFLIYTSEELTMVGLYACEWDKRFKLMADIDLSAFDGAHGRPKFNVIGGNCRSGFSGVFDGNSHTISHLTLQGASDLDQFGYGLFGCISSGGKVKNLGVVDANITTQRSRVGALAGLSWGTVTQCYSTGGVSSGDLYVGGLVGENSGTVAQCYSTAAVTGEGYVGGLIGENYGHTICCYSTGAVSGRGAIGGLEGYSYGSVQCFWDIQTSGQTWNSAGRGKTTAEMQTASTFMEAGWDFVGETANGTEDIWWILEGQNYPRLWWEMIFEN